MISREPHQVRILIAVIMVVMTWMNGRGQDSDPRFDEFVQRNKIFRPYSGYILIASGMNYNPGTGAFEKASSLGFHFRIGRNHFHTGYHVSSDRFFLYRSNQMLSDIYLMYGHRKDTVKYNLGYYGGITYGFGSKFHHFTSFNGVRTNYYLSFHKIGLYAEAEYTRKITYDFGLGVSAYLSANEAYQVAGIKLHLYFSGAYRGSIE